MKLNLWMIVNQLSKYDIETEVSSSTDRIISGPLPVITDNSLYVRSNGSDVLCYSKQGTITIHGLEEDEGFLLIQSIFNWYDIWLDNVEDSLRRGDFRSFVHLCAKVFSNPVLFMDSNNSLLGIDCRNIDIDLIPEWKYIYENEQCSVAFFNTMMNAIRNPYKEYNNNVCSFGIFSKDENDKEYHTSGLLASVKYQANEFGKFVVLDKSRALNPGDVALMELLVEKAALFLAASAKASENVLNYNVMNRLLEGNSVSKDNIEYNSSLIRGMNPDKASRFGLIVFRDDSSDRNYENIEFLQHILSRRFPKMFTWVYRGDLLAIVNVPNLFIQGQQVSLFLNSQGYNKSVKIGVSLAFDSLEDLTYYYKQCMFAIDEGTENMLSFFYNYAHIFLLGNYNKDEKKHATEPICRRIWYEQPDKRDFLKTAVVYLECERATGLASGRLFIHRNTLNYRVNYLKEYADWDYDDPELRDYLRLSYYYLSSEL